MGEVEESVIVSSQTRADAFLYVKGLVAETLSFLYSFIQIDLPHIYGLFMRLLFHQMTT